MEASKKILILTSVLSLGAVFYFLNRKAKFSILNINWKEKKGIYKFGSITKDFSNEIGALFNDRYYIKDQFHLNGGKSYPKNRFLNVTNSLDKQKTFFEIENKDGIVIDKKTIDWFTKLIY